MSKPVFLPLAAGLQTELADQLVQPGATLILENASHQQTGEAQLRLASDVLATTATPTLPPGGALPTPWQLATLGGSLVRFNRAPVPLHTWAATPERWVRPTNDNGGIASYRKGPIQIDSTPVYSGAQAGDNVSIPDVAVSGDVLVEVYETFTLSGAATGTAVVIMDRETRTPIYTRRTGSGTRCPKVVIAGGRAVVAYESGGALQVDSYNLTTFVIAQTQTLGAVEADTPIDVRVGGPVAGANMVHILYREDTGGELRCAVVDATALGTNQTFTPRTPAAAVVVPDIAFGWMQDLGVSGVYAIMIADTTAGLRVLWDLVPPTAGNSDADELHVLDATATDPPEDPDGIRNLIGSTVTNAASGRYRVLYEVTGMTFITRGAIKNVIYDGATAVADDPILSVGIRSKLWLHETDMYFVGVFPGPDQRSHFVLAVPFSITTDIACSAPLAVSNVRDAGGLTESFCAPSSAAAGPDGEIYVGVTSETRIESITAAAVATGTTEREMAIEVVRIRHSSAVETEVGTPAEMLRSLFVPGGLLGQFDGSTYATAGFAYYPPFITGTSLSGGSLTADATYLYKALYSFVDRNGRKWRSATTTPLTIGLTGSEGQNELTIDTLRLWDRGLASTTGGGYQIEVYRTQANSTEGYFLVATVANDPTANTITVTDSVADTALGEQLYTDGGGVENQILPPISNAVEHQGRLICSEAGVGTIWYSVEADFQSGLIFNEALTLDIGDPNEAITGLAVYGQTLFVFKAGKVYVVDGQGNNALGQGATYTARLIGVGVGCSNPQSIAVADDGVWFRSSGARAGMYRTAGGAPEYVGAGVRAYDDGVITSAVVVGDQTEIRFYQEDGRTLVWNWTTRSWSTNTEQPCLTATTGYEPVTGVVYANEDDESILAEATTGSDDPYLEGGEAISLRASTPWYQAAGIGGWERVKRIQGIGTVAEDGAHSAVIRVYKNFEASPFQTVSKQFDGTEEVWDWELRPKEQKVTSFRIEVEIQPYQPPTVVASITPSGSAVSLPEGLVFWVRGDIGVTTPGGLLTEWEDQSGYDQHLDYVGAGEEIEDFGADTLDGIPGATPEESIGFAGPFSYIARATPILNRSGVPFGYGTGEHQPRTIFAVIRPNLTPAVFNIAGGPVCIMNSAPPFGCIFDLESNFHADGFYLEAKQWRDPTSGARRGPDTPVATYDGLGTLVMWRSSGHPDLDVEVNAVDQALTPDSMDGTPGPQTGTNFILGNVSTDSFANVNFLGSIFEVMIFDTALSAPDVAIVVAYFAARYPSIGL